MGLLKVCSCQTIHWWSLKPTFSLTVSSDTRPLFVNTTSGMLSSLVDDLRSGFRDAPWSAYIKFLACECSSDILVNIMHVEVTHNYNISFHFIAHWVLSSISRLLYSLSLPWRPIYLIVVPSLVWMQTQRVSSSLYVFWIQVD